MGENLATKSLGGVGGFYPWLLHNNGTDPATGFRLTLGDGTELPFWIDEDGVSLVNAAGHKLALRHALTADGQLNLNKTPLSAKLLADFSNSTTTGTDVPDFGFALQVDKIYKISGIMVCTSTATNRGVQIAVAGPSASVDFLEIQMSHIETTVINNNNRRHQRLTSFFSYYDAATAPEAGTPYLTLLSGLIKTNGVSPASNVGLRIKSSSGGNAAVIKAGSFMQFEEF